MISIYAHHEHGKEALKLSYEMFGIGMGAKEYTFKSILISYSSLTTLKHRKMIHYNVIATRFDMSIHEK